MLQAQDGGGLVQGGDSGGWEQWLARASILGTC